MDDGDTILYQFHVTMNMYGHPADEVIKRYEDAGSMVFRTDMQGAVGVFGREIKAMKQK